MLIKDPRKKKEKEEDPEADRIERILQNVRREEDLSVKNDMKCAHDCAKDNLPILSLEEAQEAFMKIAREGGNQMDAYMELLHRTPRDLRSIWMTWLLGLTMQRLYSGTSSVAEVVTNGVIDTLHRIPPARALLQQEKK